MTIRFLIGPAGAGKTRFCLETLRRRERQGLAGIYIVPEQFTYSADRELLASGDLAGLRHVRVLSFSRLAWWLRERSGAAASSFIDPSVRPMYLRAVLERMPPERLGPLVPLRSRQGLLEELGRFIGEVRNHGTTRFLEGLGRLGEASIAPLVASKLRALGEVFQEYDAFLRDRGRRDPEEHLYEALPLIAAESALFSGTHVSVDGFLSWTRREADVLVALALAGATVDIALCMDADATRGPLRAGDARSLSVRLPFRPVLRSFGRLRDRFEAAGLGAGEVVALPSSPRPRGVRAELASLERRLYDASAADGAGQSGTDADRAVDASEGTSPPPHGAALLLRPTRDPHHEVLTWARLLDRRLRLERPHLRPEEIGIFLRDVERYREPIARIFPRYGIDYFLDERRPVLAHPWVRLLLGALDILAGGWQRTAVIGLLRNPLLRLAPARVDLLENLSLSLGRDFEHWFDASDWEVYSLPDRSQYSGRSGEVVQDPILDPEPGADDDETAEGERENGIHDEERGPESGATRRAHAVESVDAIRRQILLPLRSLERDWVDGNGWTGDEAVRGLVELVSLWVALPPPSRDPEWDQRVQSSVGDLLGELADLWGETRVPPEEFARTLKAGLLGLRLGVTPMRRGQVLIADVQRSRVEGIRLGIVGGVNEGIFPRTVADDPILGERDREALESLGVALGPTARERQEEEAYLFYIAMTRAAEQVVVTWSAVDAAGKESAPSILIEEIARALPGIAARLAPMEEEDALDMDGLGSGAELGPALLTRLLALVRAGASADSADGAAGTRAERAPADAPRPAGGTAEAPRLDAAEILWERVQGDARLAAIREEVDRAGRAVDREEHLPAELLPALFGDELRSSVSRLQEFASCPFRSFASSILRLEPRPEARITPLETGTLAHGALELFFSAASDEELAAGAVPDPAAPPHPVAREGIRRRLDAVFARLESEPAYRAFRVDEASRYRWASTRRSLARFLDLELERLHRSEYRVAHRELPFGLGDRAPLELALPDDRKLLLRGRIDRVDVRTEAGGDLGIVIDYKRSGRSGLPGSLERGLDLQLAAYLLFLRQRLGMEPAGGLYVPVLPSPPREEKADTDQPNALRIRAHGIVLQGEADRFDGRIGLLVGRGDQRLADTTRRDELLATGASYLASYAHNQSRGWIAARPLQTEPSRLPCDHCDYASVCRFRPGRDPRRRRALEGMEAAT